MHKAVMVSDGETGCAWPGVGVTLDTVLQRDRRRLPGVLQWVRYSARASIQMEAIKLAHILSSRMGTFVDLLLQAPADSEPGACFVS